MTVRKLARTRKQSVQKSTKLHFIVDVEYGGEGASVEDSQRHLEGLLRYASAARVWRGPGGVDTRGFVVTHSSNPEKGG